MWTVEKITALVCVNFEELGIAISADELEHIFYRSPSKETGYEFINSFKLSRPIHPIPSETEVLEVREVQLQELKSWMKMIRNNLLPRSAFFLLVWERLPDHIKESCPEWGSCPGVSSCLPSLRSEFASLRGTFNITFLYR